MINRTNIRDTFAVLLAAKASPVSVEKNRTHAVSALPLINLKSGFDEAMVEEYTNSDRPRRYRLKAEINVGSLDHDAETDGYIELIKEVTEENEKNQYWSACYVEDIEDPEDIPGELEYCTTTVTVLFMYEE